jgi:hypothetical protein
LIYMIRFDLDRLMPRGRSDSQKLRHPAPIGYHAYRVFVMKAGSDKHIASIAI